MTQKEVGEWIESIIPKSLWEKYAHLSYEEMAEIDELSDFRGEIEQAIELWYSAPEAN